jgi:hypothetical protein
VIYVNRDILINNENMKKSFSILLLAIVMLMPVTSCKKDKGKPPVLPPYESMAIDFNKLTDSKKSSAGFSETKDVPDPDENFMFSAGVVGFWNLILTVNLVVPVTAFKLAVSNTPVWVADKTWEWKYSVSGVVGTYKARLVGKTQAANIKWEMYITREGTGAFAEFLWFEGTTALDGSSGQWIVNVSNQVQQPYLQIDWTKTGTNIGSVKYTYLRAQNDAGGTDLFKNSYIQYGLTTAALNAYYTVHVYEPLVTQGFVDVFIEQNSTAGNGRVKALYKFGDNLWHCWDADKNNITCPS